MTAENVERKVTAEEYNLLAFFNIYSDVVADRIRSLILLQPAVGALVEKLAALAHREHYSCEDSWYSCPKSEDGSSDESAGSECNCSADAHNEKVSNALADYTEACK